MGGKKSKFKDFLFDYIYYFHSLNNTEQKQVTSCNPQYQWTNELLWPDFDLFE